MKTSDEIVEDICRMIGIEHRRNPETRYLTRDELVHLHGYLTATSGGTHVGETEEEEKPADNGVRLADSDPASGRREARMPDSDE